MPDTPREPSTLTEEDHADQEDRTYEPDPVEVNLARQQGLGVGQKDLDYQRDATEGDDTEHFGFVSDSEALTRESEGDVEHGGEGRGGTDVEHGLGGRGGVEQP